MASDSLLVVRTPKMIGVSSSKEVFKTLSLMLWEIISKWGVSPLIIHPIAIIACGFFVRAFLHAYISSKLPGTLTFFMIS